MVPAGPSDPSIAEEAVPLAPWFHNIHLPDGRQTAPLHPLGDFPAFKWAQFSSGLPADLTGWTALDVGCNAGFYTLELARRGATVTALEMDPHFLRQARWAAERWELDSAIEFRQGSVYEVAHWAETFDLILFMGVFYHLRHPLLALDLLAARTRRMMVFQSLSLPETEVTPTPADQGFQDREALLRPGWPRMAFVEHAFAGDLTNWWIPNPAAIEAMLRSSGMRITGRPRHEIYFAVPDPHCHPHHRSVLASELQQATGSALISFP